MLGVPRCRATATASNCCVRSAASSASRTRSRRTPVGVYFGEPGTTVPDPYFGGEGPERTGCTFCGACMVGCREGAKNTLLKNYLWFAEKRGAEIVPEREVVDIRPLGAQDGSEGYVVTTERPGAWFRKQRRTLHRARRRHVGRRAGHQSPAAQVQARGSLPRISDRLGQLVRTNSESILAVTLPEGMARPWNDVAISASIHTAPTRTSSSSPTAGTATPWRCSTRC